MIAYDEFSTFRTPKSEVRSPKSSRTSRSTPERIEALDDLHRALYGSVHPAAAIIESDQELVEGDAEGSSGAVGWVENNALTVAISAVACFALYSWIKKPKEPPLHGPPDVPFTPTPSSTP